MTGAHDVVFQPEEVLAQGKRDAHLENTVQGGDAHEQPLLDRKARVLVLVHLIVYLLAPLDILLRGKHEHERDRLFLVQLPVVRRNPATARVSQSKTGHFFRDDGPIRCQRRETRHGVCTVVLLSWSGAHLVPKLRQSAAPSSDPPLCTVHVEQPA